MKLAHRVTAQIAMDIEFDIAIQKVKSHILPQWSHQVIHSTPF